MREKLRSVLTEHQKKMEWVHFYKASAAKYNMNALIAVLENDGEQMLAAVLNELGLMSSVDLVKDAAKNQ